MIGEKGKTGQYQRGTPLIINGKNIPKLFRANYRH